VRGRASTTTDLVATCCDGWRSTAPHEYYPNRHMSALALASVTVGSADVPASDTILGGKYRVGEPIGNGGLGIVFRGETIASGRTIAIKVLAPAAAADPEQVTRFRREIKASANIGSDHVVRVLDSGDLPSGHPYLVMEHLDGKSLADMAKDAGELLPIELVVDWILEAIDGIAEAHSLGVIHRDLKPANLFLAIESSGGGIVKVLDFGASKLTADSLVDPSDPGGVTVATSLIGSPRYMAPEQIRSALEVDVRADVYGLGATLYELVAGTPMFASDTLARIFAQVLWEMPEPLASVRPDVPAELEAVIVKCLAKDPKDRYQTVRDLGAALAPFASLPSITAMSAATVKPPPMALEDLAEPNREAVEEEAVIVPAPAKLPSSATVRLPRFELLPTKDDRPQRTVKMNAFVLGAMRAGAGPAPPAVVEVADAPGPASSRPVAGAATVRIQRFELPRPPVKSALAVPMPAIVAAAVLFLVVAVGIAVVLLTRR